MRRAVHPHLGEDPRTLLFAPDDRAEEAADRLRQTRIAQPALFAVEYALARLWESWGVRPRAMAGHSVGEYVAACLAGVFTLEDAVRLVAARGRLVQEMPTGAMLSVFLPEAETTAWLGDGLVLAAVNSTALSVVSGPADAVDGLERRLTAASVACRRLHTSHAFHSPAMDGAVEPFVAEVRAVPLRAPASRSSPTSPGPGSPTSRPPAPTTGAPICARRSASPTPSTSSSPTPIWCPWRSAPAGP